MSRFLRQLREGLRRCGIHSERLLIGISGGADSVALLQGLAEFAAELSLQLFPAHLNHGLRGDESDADAQFVKQLSDKLNLPCEMRRASHDSLSADRSGLEENARDLRHHFLSETAERLKCTKIVLAHTLDDQSETVLHHILRGTGIAGLRGIPVTRESATGVPIVRPMLSIRRSSIEEFLSECGQEFRTDSSNQDVSLTRNWLRHKLFPQLRAEINPQVDYALGRLAEQAAEVEEVLTFAAQQLFARAVKDRQPDACRIDTQSFAGQPQHLVREVFREVWTVQGWPQQAMTFDHWNRFVELLQTHETVVFPNRIEARFHGENLLVVRQL